MNEKGSGCGCGRFGAFALLIIGSLLLLINLGVLNPDIWGEILSYWPVLLIIFGLRIFFSGRPNLYLLVDILTVLLILSVIFLAALSTSQELGSWLKDTCPWWPGR